MHCEKLDSTLNFIYIIYSIALKQKIAYLFNFFEITAKNTFNCYFQPAAIIPFIDSW